MSRLTGPDRIRENRLRRVAARQGLHLRKSRRRDARALDYGQYWLIDPHTNTITAGGDHGMDLDAIDQALGETGSAA